MAGAEELDSFFRVTAIGYGEVDDILSRPYPREVIGKEVSVLRPVSWQNDQVSAFKGQRAHDFRKADLVADCDPDPTNFRVEYLRFFLFGSVYEPIRTDEREVSLTVDANDAIRSDYCGRVIAFGVLALEEANDHVHIVFLADLNDSSQLRPFALNRSR